ncbi:ATP-dependent RNA helicase DED1 [Diplonema papillatum]|nr:ATP-dependent RNA helicase DED1 [Diplonema papillatum]
MSYVPPSVRRKEQQQQVEPPVESDPSAYSAPRDDGGKGGKKGGGKGGVPMRSQNSRGGSEGGKGGGYGDRGGGGRKGGDRNEWGNSSIDEDMTELFKNTRTATGLNFDKNNDVPVAVSGGPNNLTEEDTPDLTPIASFEGGVLSAGLYDNIERAKYRKPTPIQQWSIPVMFNQRDLMACAQTGSGKTGAFLFPIISMLLQNGPRQYRSPIRHGQVAPEACILAPTRELVAQIHEEARKFCYETGLRSVAVYGGVDLRLQLTDIEKGCQIVVATPGRLNDLTTSRDRPSTSSQAQGKGGGKRTYRQYAKIALSNVFYLALDEADRMLDLGFELQIRQLITEKDMPPPGERLTMMLSATFPAPIQRLAADFLSRDYYFVKVGRVGSTNTGITQTLEYCSDTEKKEFLIALLRHSDARKLVLVFVDTKSNANSLVDKLVDAGWNATSIHGDRTQAEREAALKAFRNSETPILVATDVASRGLDIPNVSHVVQYDLAHNLDDYTHRIGRTGRAGHSGLATSFFNEKNRGVGRSLLTYLQQHGQDVPQKLIDIVSSAPEPNVRRDGGKGSRDNTATGRQISRKQLADQQKTKEPAAPSYQSGNVLMSMMGGTGGGQY